MGFVKLVCPSCGANIQLDGSKDFGFCNYCGTKIVQEKTIIEHRGTISVDGISNEKALLDRAFLFIEDSNYDKAAKYLEKALDLNPHCSKAYLGKFLCQIKLNSLSSVQTRSTKLLSNYDNFLKAKRFASQQELAEYIAVEQAVSIRIKSQEKEYQNKLDKDIARVRELNEFLENNKKDYLKYTAKGTALLFATSALVILTVIILAMCISLFKDPEYRTISILAIIFLLFPAIAASVFCIIKGVKSQRFINDYKKKKALLDNGSKEMHNSQDLYYKWKNEQSRKVSDKAVEKVQDDKNVKKPLNNIKLIRSKAQSFAEMPIIIFIDERQFAQAPKSGDIELNLSIGTHTMFFKCGDMSSSIIPISINGFNNYTITYEKRLFSIKTNVKVYEISK